MVILGAGPAGLIAGYVFRKHRPVILEAAPWAGGAFRAGGFRYVRDTPEMYAFVRSVLGDEGSVVRRKIQGAVLAWDRAVMSHPQGLLLLTESERQRLQMSHWVKTRGSMAGYEITCMNDPAYHVRSEERGLFFDFERLLGNLSAMLDIRYHHQVSKVDWRQRRVTAQGEEFEYERLIVTLPLPVMSQVMRCWDLPEARHNYLTVMDVRGPKSLPWKGCDEVDYLYTPLERWITRLSVDRYGAGGIALEAVVDDVSVDLRGAMCDLLNFGACDVVSGRKVAGHLLPLKSGGSVEWPAGIAAVGRYAEWKPRQTLDRVMDRLLMLQGDSRWS